ncbi:hypothetical protein PAPYR_10497 [Paratrimastix pyriformis]|uniref:RRM domain-containing protein n=1 Tax=Paratrimastix pyriformis TaxID=342808 RepID=A0ABQ8U5T6_9EUKA|nr:hypothetical protein PAPYR_10497 [Paratrimastix pyriformis]
MLGQYGQIKQINIVNSPTSFKTFAFVTFSTIEQATRAVGAFKSKRHPSGCFVSYSNRSTVVRRRKVFLRNLPENCSEEKLNEICGPFGEIESTRFLTENCCVALVNYVKQNDADQAVAALNNKVLPGCTFPLMVHYSETAQARLQRIQNRTRQHALSSLAHSITNDPALLKAAADGQLGVSQYPSLSLFPKAAAPAATSISGLADPTSLLAQKVASRRKRLPLPVQCRATPEVVESEKDHTESPYFLCVALLGVTWAWIWGCRGHPVLPMTHRSLMRRDDGEGYESSTSYGSPPTTTGCRRPLVYITGRSSLFSLSFVRRRMMGACASVVGQRILGSPDIGGAGTIGSHGFIDLIDMSLPSPQRSRIEQTSIDCLPPELILNIIEMSSTPIQACCVFLAMNHSIRAMLQHAVTSLDFDLPVEISDDHSPWRPVPTALALSALVGSCCSLKELSLPAMRAMTGSLTSPGWVDRAFDPHRASLRYLCVRSVDGLTQETLCQIVGRLGALETLILGEPDGASLNWQFVDPLLATLGRGSCPQLRRLEIHTYCPAMMDYRLLMDCCPLLESVDLPMPAIDQYNRDGLIDFLCSLPNLKHLDVFDVDLGNLPHPEHITHLALALKTPDVADRFVALCQSFAGLVFLKIGFPSSAWSPSAESAPLFGGGLLACAETLRVLEIFELPDRAAAPLFTSLLRMPRLEDVALFVRMADGDGEGALWRAEEGEEVVEAHVDRSHFTEEDGVAEEDESPLEPAVFTDLLLELIGCLLAQVTSLRLQVAPFSLRIPAADFVFRGSAQLRNLQMSWVHEGPFTIHAPALETLQLPQTNTHTVTLYTPRLRCLENPPAEHPLVSECPMPDLDTVRALEAPADPETPVGQLLATLPGLRRVFVDRMTLSHSQPLLARPLDQLEIRYADFEFPEASEGSVLALSTAVCHLRMALVAPPGLLKITAPRLRTLGVDCWTSETAGIALDQCPELTRLHANNLAIAPSSCCPLTHLHARDVGLLVQSAGTLQDVGLWTLSSAACVQLSTALRDLPRLRRLGIYSPSSTELHLASTSVQILAITAYEGCLKQITLDLPALEEFILHGSRNLQPVHFIASCPALGFVAAIAPAEVEEGLAAVIPAGCSLTVTRPDLL